MSGVQMGDVKNKKYKLVPPDGGWGYMICVAVTINSVVLTAFATCFGLLFGDFMAEVQMSTTSVTLMNGLSGIVMAVSGFMVAPLLRIMSERQISFIGSILASIGTVATVFINSEGLFVISQGLVLSAGYGILYNITFTMLNEYFLKKQLLAVTVTQTIAAGAAIVTPKLVEISLFEYGYRGTLALISGLTFNVFVATVLLQPVSWHMKRDVTIEEEAEELINILLIEEKNTKCGIQGVPTVTITDKESDVNVKEKYEKDSENSLPESSTRKGITQTISKFIDLSLCKSFMLSSACLGTTTSIFVDFNFVLFLPQALKVEGWEDSGVAWALTLTAFGDLITRILFIVFNRWLRKVENQIIFVIGIVIGFVTRLGFLWSKNHTVMLTFIVIMGISRCILTILPPVVISEAVGHENFSQAMGLFMMFFGIFSLVLGPALGAIRDLTDSYTTVFYVMTSILPVIVIFWVIEMIYKKNKYKRDKRKLQMDSADTTSTNKKK